MFRLGHRAFPMVIGVSAMTTLSVNVAVAVSYRSSPSPATQQPGTVTAAPWLLLLTAGLLSALGVRRLDRSGHLVPTASPPLVTK